MKTLFAALLLGLLLPPMVLAQATIKGEVTNLMTGEPLQGVRVDLRTAENTDPAVQRVVWTDAQGRYRLDDVPAGRWRVRAVLLLYNSDRLIITPPADVARRTTVFNFTFSTGRLHRHQRAGIVRSTPLDAPSSDKIEVKGYVLDALNAAPLRAATVRLMAPTEAAAGRIRYQTVGKAKVDRRGRYRIDGLEAGTYLLHVSRSAYDTLQTIYTTLSASMRMDLALMPTDPAPLRLPVLGKVRDGQGRILHDAILTSAYPPTPTVGGRLYGRITHRSQPATGASVHLMESYHQTQTDADGLYTLARIPPHPYRLRIIYDGDTLDMPPLFIDDGPNEVNVTLETTRERD